MTTCGTGGWTGPLPGDPGNNAILSAVQKLGGIEVSWTYPTTFPEAIAYTKLYRAVTSTFSGLQIATVGGAVYFDRVSTGTTYYYWIQIVSKNGTEGDLIGPVSATALPLLAELLSTLAGAITSDALSVELNNKLGEITALQGFLNDETGLREAADSILSSSIDTNINNIATLNGIIVNESDTRAAQYAYIIGELTTAANARASEAAARIQGDADEAAARAGDLASAAIAWALADADLAVTVGNNTAAIASERQVTADGLSAQAIAKDALVAQVADSAAVLYGEATIRATATEALANQTSLLFASVNDSTAALLNEKTLRADADSAQADTLTLLSAEIGDTKVRVFEEVNLSATRDEATAQVVGLISAGLGDAVGSIVNETNIRATEDEVTNNQLVGLSASVGDALGAITTEKDIRVTESEATAKLINAMSAEVGDSRASLLSESEVRANADVAQSSVLSGMSSELGSSSAAIINERQTRTTNELARAIDYSAMAAALGDNSASLVVERETRVTALNAVSAEVVTLTSALGNNTAAVQQTTATVNGIANLYAVKADINGYVSGFGLMQNLAEGGIPISKFYVNVDQFAVTTPQTSIPNRANSTAYVIGNSVRNPDVTQHFLVCISGGTSASSQPTAINSLGTASVGDRIVDGTVKWQVASAVPFAVLTSPATINGVNIPQGTYIDGAFIRNINADLIDTRGLSIRDEQGNVILAAGSALDWSNVGGLTKPADNATANPVYEQASAPTGTIPDGAIWIDTDDNNKLYLRSSGSWVLRRDSGVDTALAQAALAKDTADGKIDSFYQTTAPTTGMSLGDLWFDTDDGNKLYRYDGSSWGIAQDTAIGTAINTANSAQTAVATKVTTFFTTSTPTATAVGDLWYSTSTSLLKRWDGSTWTTVSNSYTNTNQLTDGAGLGTTATWSSVTGTGKPADNATANQSDTITNNSIATKLAKGAADTLTGPIVLNSTQALYIGTLNDGVYFGSTGLVGRKGGANTFVIDAAGNATFAGALSAATGSFAGSVNVGAFTGYAWPAAGNYGAHLGPNGLLLGNYNNGKYIEIQAGGNIYAPGFSIVNGVMTIYQVDVINTVNIANEAVTTTKAGSHAGGAQYYSTEMVLITLASMTLPASASVMLLLDINIGAQISDSDYPAWVRLKRNGTVIHSVLTMDGLRSNILDTPGAGTWTYSVTVQGSQAGLSGDILASSFLAMGAKK